MVTQAAGASRRYATAHWLMHVWELSRKTAVATPDKVLGKREPSTVHTPLMAASCPHTFHSSAFTHVPLRVRAPYFFSLMLTHIKASSINASRVKEHSRCLQPNLDATPSKTRLVRGRNQFRISFHADVYLCSIAFLRTG